MDTIEKTPPDHSKESLGQYLSRMRKKKKIDLKNIAVITRINYNILSDLECDRFDNLPNRTYLRGFIRSLAKEISADKEYALALLDQHLKEHKSLQSSQSGDNNKVLSSPIPLNPILNKDFSKLENIKRHYRKIPTKYIIASLGILMILGGGGLLLRKAFIATNQEAQKFLEKETQTKKNKEQETEEKQKESIAIKEEPKKENTETATQTSERTIETSLGSIILTKMEYPLYALDPNHPKLQDKKLFPQRIRKIYSSGQAHVFINAVKGETWMVYKNSNDPIRSFTLKKGKTLFLRGKEIRLFLGNLGAVEIFYNNQYLQAKSDNQVRSLIFPHELAKKSEVPFFIYDKKAGKHHLVTDIIKNKVKTSQPTP